MSAGVAANTSGPARARRRLDTAAAALAVGIGVANFITQSLPDPSTGILAPADPFLDEDGAGRARLPEQVSDVHRHAHPCTSSSSGSPNSSWAGETPRSLSRPRWTWAISFSMS